MTLTTSLSMRATRPPPPPTPGCAQTSPPPQLPYSSARICHTKQPREKRNHCEESSDHFFTYSRMYRTPLHPTTTSTPAPTHVSAFTSDSHGCLAAFKLFLTLGPVAYVSNSRFFSPHTFWSCFVVEVLVLFFVWMQI